MPRMLLPWHPRPQQAAASRRGGRADHAYPTAPRLTGRRRSQTSTAQLGVPPYIDAAHSLHQNWFCANCDMPGEPVSMPKDCGHTLWHLSQITCAPGC